MAFQTCLPYLLWLRYNFPINAPHDVFHEFSKVHVAMRFNTPENWKVSELNDLVFNIENVA